MAKRVYRSLTPAERAHSRRTRAALEEEKPEIIAKGQAIFEKHEMMRDAVAVLKAEREAQGLSLADLEQRTGIAKSSLSRLENERNANPTIDTLMKIADALGRSLSIRLDDAA